MLTSVAQAVLPSSIMALHSVGDVDAAPNLGLIMELELDLILSSQRLSDENIAILESAGIAVIEDTLIGDKRERYITNLALILNAEQRVQVLINFETYYENLVKDRVADLSQIDKPWFSTGPSGSYVLLIEDAGSINAGENTTISFPQLSAEVVVEQNPDIFIRMLDYTSGENFDSFKALWTEIVSRPGINELNATQDENVYVITSTILVDRDVIGLLYFAKWFHPPLFIDIDPTAIHAELIELWFGTTLQGVYFYP